jgi:hypothetical protein
MQERLKKKKKQQQLLHQYRLEGGKSMCLFGMVGCKRRPLKERRATLDKYGVKMSVKSQDFLVLVREVEVECLGDLRTWICIAAEGK